MNKDLFLEQLERLLYEIPKEERDEAMDYYRSYFDDAGVENEAIVLEELESPKIIADSIKEALNSTGDMTGALKNPPQVRDGQTSGKYGYGKNQSGRGYKSIFSGSDFRKKEEQTSSSDKYTQSEGANRYQSQGGADYRKYDQYERRSGQNDGRADRRTKLILFIILAVFTSPVWGTVLSGALGIVGILLAIIVALGVCSIGGVIGGIVCTVVAIVKLCSLSFVKGLFILGIGMLLIAGSGLSMILVMLVCGRFLPWIFRQIVQLFQRVLQWGRSAA